MYDLSTHIQCLPFRCSQSPTLYETKEGIIFMQTKHCGYFEIIANRLQWKIARLIWIAFYKNETNKKCFLSQLPKGIITNYILKFIGGAGIVKIQNGRNSKGQTLFDVIQV